MNRMNRSILSLALVLALMLGLAAFSAQADKYDLIGDGNETTIFFVESFGSARLDFTQTEGICHEMTSTHLINGISVQEKEWGKYHIQVETPTGNSYTEEWNLTFDGGSYSLTLNGSGTYRIAVIPYTAEEITKSWTMDTFVSWTNAPQWWISGQMNCIAKANISTSVYVQKVDQDTGAVLDSQSAAVNYGYNTVSAGDAPSGYTLVSNPTAVVYVDASGRADVSTVTFFYKRDVPKTSTLTVNCYDEGEFVYSYVETIAASGYIAPRSFTGYNAVSGSVYVTFNPITGTCEPASVNFHYTKKQQPAPANVVKPYFWDTQFKPDTCTTDNQTRYQDLPKLYDDNPNTSFWWLVWNSERTDDIPEITAYFNGDTVSTISIRNNTDKEYARATRFRVVIYHANGVSTSYIELGEGTKEYQTKSLGGTFTGVSRIELFLDGFHTGTGITQFYIGLWDMRFGN